MLSEFFLNLYSPSQLGIWENAKDLGDISEFYHKKVMDCSVFIMQQTWESINSHPTLMDEISKNQLAQIFSDTINYENQVRGDFPWYEQDINNSIAQANNPDLNPKIRFREITNFFDQMRKDRTCAMYDACDIIKKSELPIQENVINKFNESLFYDNKARISDNKYVTEMGKTWKKYKALAIENKL